MVGDVLSVIWEEAKNNNMHVLRSCLALAPIPADADHVRLEDPTTLAPTLEKWDPYRLTGLTADNTTFTYSCLKMNPN